MSTTTRSPPGPPRTHLLFTHPRTASNLLIRMLNLDQQPNVFHADPSTSSNTTGNGTGYFFLPTMATKWFRLATHSQHPSTLTAADTDKLRVAFQKGYDALQGHIDAATEKSQQTQLEGQQIVYVKEHVGWLINPTAEAEWVFRDSEEYRDATSTHGGEESSATQWMVESQAYPGSSHTNETVLPDTFLLSITPTFLIRHPALVFPSLYRTSIDLEGKETAQKEDGPFQVEMTLRWSRRLYDWYLAQESKLNRDGSGYSSPIILDADDIMDDADMVKKYAEKIGLDPESVVLSWESVGEEKAKSMSKMESRMLSTLVGSKGIVKGLSAAGAGLDIDKEVVKWRMEFGEGEAKRMEKWVRDAMPDYEYLRGKRFTGTSKAGHQ